MGEQRQNRNSYWQQTPNEIRIGNFSQENGGFEIEQQASHLALFVRGCTFWQAEHVNILAQPAFPTHHHDAAQWWSTISYA